MPLGKSVSNLSVLLRGGRPGSWAVDLVGRSTWFRGGRPVEAVDLYFRSRPVSLRVDLFFTGRPL